MSIDDQPMNVYWSGKRTETSSTFKITDKGSVAAYTNLPSSGNQKGDKYEVTSDGSDYVWNGYTWNRLGAEKYAYEDIVNMPDFALDTNVVHNTGTENISGSKKFASNPTISSMAPYLSFIENDIQKGDSKGAWGGFVYKDKNSSEIGKLEFGKNASNDSWVVVTLNDCTGGTGSAEKIFFYRTGSTGEISLQPETTNVHSLGASNKLWSELFAGSGTINTSDERIKESINSIPDEVLDAWGDVNWVQFQMKDAVQKKGIDARLHSGLIAQHIDAVFKVHGLDASRYGLFCYDEWEAVEELRDDIGNVVQEAAEAGNQYSLRYGEALCMEAAYQRRRADKLEARVKVLEEKLK